MIIIIAGASSIGKTYMAQKLLEKYHIPYLSIDHLKMGLFRGDKNCGFTPLHSNEAIGKKLWPILKGIIMTNIENDQHLIIEGCYIFPEHLKELPHSYLEKIVAVFFGFSAKYIEKNYESINKHRNIIEERTYAEDRPITELIKEHETFKNKCLAENIHYFEITHCYEQELLAVYKYIENATDNIRRKNIK